MLIELLKSNRLDLPNAVGAFRTIEIQPNYLAQNNITIRTQGEQSTSKLHKRQT